MNPILSFIIIFIYLRPGFDIKYAQWKGKTYFWDCCIQQQSSSASPSHSLDLNSWLEFSLRSLFVSETRATKAQRALVIPRVSRGLGIWVSNFISTGFPVHWPVQDPHAQLSTHVCPQMPGCWQNGDCGCVYATTAWEDPNPLAVGLWTFRL